MALRLATDDDWHAMFGIPAPGRWFGMVEANDWMIEGLGAIYLGTDDKWWMTFQRAPGVRKVKTAHAGAMKLLAAAREQGLEIHAIAHPEIRGAEMWLKRLGFAPELKHGEVDIWLTR